MWVPYSETIPLIKTMSICLYTLKKNESVKALSALLTVFSLFLFTCTSQASVACVRVQAVQASYQKPPLSPSSIQSHNALLHLKISGQDYSELDRDILQLCGTHTCIHAWRYIYYWQYIFMFATIKTIRYDVVKVWFTESKIKLGSLLLNNCIFF